MTFNFVIEYGNQISVPPELVVPYREISQQLGSPTHMTCVVTASPLPSELYWEHKGDRLVDSDKFKIMESDIGNYQRTISAQVNDITDSDFGIYKCIVRNDLGQAEDRVTISGG